MNQTKSYFNFRPLGDDTYLVTNDGGYYAFVNRRELGELVLGTVDFSTPKGQELKEKCFVTDGSSEELIDRLVPEIRGENYCLLGTTSLFIFVLTTACNLQCIYCQARSGDEITFATMTEETAEKAVDFALQCPQRDLTFEFQGGEPLTAFPVLRHIVEYTEAHRKEHNITFSLVSNLLLADATILDFLQEHHVQVSTSLDGCRAVHDHNRPTVTGGPTFDDVVRQIHTVRNAGIPLGAIETTTRYGLAYPHELVDTYKDLGFDQVFIRPLTPMGYAVKNRADIWYTPDEFLSFYRTALAYIIDCNRKGTFLREGHAVLFLRQILCRDGGNYMELRSPCGGVIGQLAIIPGGNIYTCDEGRMLGEMGDNMFRLGNVQKNTFSDIICGTSCKAMMAASHLASLPACSECAYQPYCGTCPVINYGEHGGVDPDIYPDQPNGFRCQIYAGILDTLFSYLHDNDPQIMEIFDRWVN